MWSIRILEIHYHPVQWNASLEDLYIIQILNIISIPRITKELPKKLFESLPIIPK